MSERQYERKFRNVATGWSPKEGSVQETLSSGMATLVYPAGASSEEGPLGNLLRLVRKGYGDVASFYLSRLEELGIRRVSLSFRAFPYGEVALATADVALGSTIVLTTRFQGTLVFGMGSEEGAYLEAYFLSPMRGVHLLSSLVHHPSASRGSRISHLQLGLVGFDLLRFEVGDGNPKVDPEYLAGVLNHMSLERLTWYSLNNLSLKNGPSPEDPLRPLDGEESTLWAEYLDLKARSFLNLFSGQLSPAPTDLSIAQFLRSVSHALSGECLLVKNLGALWTLEATLSLIRRAGPFEERRNRGALARFFGETSGPVALGGMQPPFGLSALGTEENIRDAKRRENFAMLEGLLLLGPVTLPRGEGTTLYRSLLLDLVLI